MSDWISRQLDDVAAKREQADKELAERRAKFKAEWEAAWVAEAPIRQRAQATADRLVADAHRLLLSGKIAPKELAFTLYIHFRRVRPTAWERVHDVTTEPINLGRAWPIVGNGYYMGLWIDEEGKLRRGALEHRTVQGWLEDELTYERPTYDGAFPRALWYRPLEDYPDSYRYRLYKDVAKELMPFRTETDRPAHCQDCASGTPVTPYVESEFDDPHNNLLARQLVLGLQRLGAI